MGKKVKKSKIRTLWTHKFINKVIPDKRKKKEKHKKCFKYCEIE